jgi:uncharacterized CHY-type Zn-finger protein
MRTHGSTYYAHCLDCGEHFERRYDHSSALNSPDCPLCGTDRKALHEADCASENACEACVSGLLPEERRELFQFIKGGKL